MARLYPQMPRCHSSALPLRTHPEPKCKVIYEFLGEYEKHMRFLQNEGCEKAGGMGDPENGSSAGRSVLIQYDIDPCDFGQVDKRMTDL